MRFVCVACEPRPCFADPDQAGVDGVRPVVEGTLEQQVARGVGGEVLSGRCAGRASGRRRRSTARRGRRWRPGLRAAVEPHAGVVAAERGMADVQGGLLADRARPPERSGAPTSRGSGRRGRQSRAAWSTSTSTTGTTSASTSEEPDHSTTVAWLFSPAWTTIRGSTGESVGVDPRGRSRSAARRPGRGARRRRTGSSPSWSLSVTNPSAPDVDATDRGRRARAARPDARPAGRGSASSAIDVDRHHAAVADEHRRRTVRHQRRGRRASRPGSARSADGGTVVAIEIDVADTAVAPLLESLGSGQRRIARRQRAARRFRWHHGAWEEVGSRVSDTGPSISDA